MGAIMLEKPDDIVKFGEQFFSALGAQDGHKISATVPAAASPKEVEESKSLSNVSVIFVEP